MLSKEFPRLYAKSSNGKIKFWEVKARSLGTDLLAPAEIFILYGYVGQDPEQYQSTVRKVPKGKNISRANQTTPFQQACSEAQSLWNKKTDKKYVLDTSGESDKLLPMLAHDYKKRGHGIKWEEGVFVQPKLNGTRCLATRISGNEITYFSRGGKKYLTLHHLDDLLLSFLRIGETLDGEIFNPEMSLQQISSAVKNVKSQKIDPKTLQYWFYDIVFPQATFQERLKELNRKANSVLSWSDSKNSPLVFTPTYPCSREEDMKEMHKGFTEMGFEGTIIRNALGLYRPDFRSPDLQKYKDFIDDEFEIIGAKEGTGKAEGQVIWVCQTKDGKPFDCRPRGTDEERNYWWQNAEEFKGKLLTVRYQNLSDDGIPTILTGIAIRDYE